MALPLPTLTWAQGSFVSTGSATPTEQQVIDAFDTALGSATYWEKKSENSGYLEFGPKAGSNIADFRAILGSAPGASADLAPDTTTAALWIGIAPDGGILGTWNTATPYGADRWAGYWKCCATAKAETLYIIESDEILALIFRDDSLDNYYACIVGAIVDPPDAGSAEADDRVYGMIVSGTTVVSATFWNSATTFAGYGTVNGQSHMGIFRPTQPTTFDTMGRMNKTTQVDSSYIPQSLGGSILNMPVFTSSLNSPYYMPGKLRQMYITKEYTNRTVVYDSDSNVKGYVFAPNGSGNTDALLFGNG